MVTDPRIHRRRWMVLILIGAAIAVSCGEDGVGTHTTSSPPTSSGAPTSVEVTTSTTRPWRAFQELLDALLRTTDLPGDWRTAIAPDVLSGANLAPSLVAVPFPCDAGSFAWGISNHFDWHVWTTFQTTEPNGDTVLLAEMITTGNPDGLRQDLETLSFGYQACLGQIGSATQWAVEVHGSTPDFGVVSVTSGELGWSVQTNEFRLVGDRLAAVVVVEQRSTGGSSCVAPVPPAAGVCRFDQATIARIAQAAVTRLGGDR